MQKMSSSSARPHTVELIDTSKNKATKTKLLILTNKSRKNLKRIIWVYEIHDVKYVQDLFSFLVAVKCQMPFRFLSFAAALVFHKATLSEDRKKSIISKGNPYNTLTTWVLVISEDLMVNHFLPGLKCLRTDMEHLSPEHEVSSKLCLLSMRCRWQKLKCDGI